jgi:hypothetical protein
MHDHTFQGDALMQGCQVGFVNYFRTGAQEMFKVGGRIGLGKVFRVKAGPDQMSS